MHIIACQRCDVRPTNQTPSPSNFYREFKQTENVKHRSSRDRIVKITEKHENEAKKNRMLKIK